MPCADIQATILHSVGLDSQRLVFPYQGLDQELTGVAEKPRVLDGIFA